MKICPVCEARCFDDMEVCYGCLHRFAKEEERITAEGTITVPAIATVGQAPAAPAGEPVAPAVEPAAPEAESAAPVGEVAAPAAEAVQGGEPAAPAAEPADAVSAGACEAAAPGLEDDLPADCMDYPGSDDDGFLPPPVLMFDEDMLQVSIQIPLSCRSVSFTVVQEPHADCCTV